MQHSADKPARVWPVPSVEVFRESPVHQFADQMLESRSAVLASRRRPSGSGSRPTQNTGYRQFPCQRTRPQWVLFDQFLKCSLLLKRWTHVSTQCLIPASDAMEFLRQIGDVDLPG